ncbi:hypothetical protein H8D51_03520 [bacterium]|nr:hypothetical protein [bacterium]
MSISRREQPDKATRQLQLQRELDQLKKLAAERDLKVRIEQGNFSSGSCLLQEQRMIIINRRLTLEERVRALTRELASADTEDV